MLKKTELPTSMVIFDGPTNIKAMLRASVIPWKRVDMFSDPFQPGLSLQLPFTKSELMGGCIKEAVSLIFGKSTPEGVRSHNIQKAIKRWRQERRFAHEDEAKDALNDLFLPLIDQHMERLDVLKTHWQSLIASLRVLRLYQSHTPLSLWESLTNHHRGAALRFHCDNDLPLCEPCEFFPVKYSSLPKSPTDLKQEVDIIVGNKEDMRRDLREFLLVKDRLLREEKEWRAFSQDESIEFSQQVVKKPFNPDDLIAIYLGASMVSTDRQMLIDLVNAQFPRTKIYQATAKNNAFELNFQLID